MRVYHGTAAHLRASIERTGLRAWTGVTGCRQFAAEHAGDSVAGVIISFNAAPGELWVDPAYPTGLGYWIADTISPARLTFEREYRREVAP